MESKAQIVRNEVPTDDCYLTCMGKCAQTIHESMRPLPLLLLFIYYEYFSLLNNHNNQHMICVQTLTFVTNGIIYLKLCYRSKATINMHVQACETRKRCTVRWINT